MAPKRKVRKKGDRLKEKQLLRAVKKMIPTTTREQVEDSLAEQDTYTLHKPVRHSFPRWRVVVGCIDHQWQANLVDVSQLEKDNQGYCFLLTVIDIF